VGIINTEDPHSSLTRGFKLKDRYEIISNIKTGGMSKVYLAKDGTLNIFCAIKELFVHLVYTGDEKEHMIKRFKEEAEMLAKLRHLALPLVIDYFSEGSFHYIIMEYVIGVDLDSMVRDKGTPGLPEADVLRWYIKTCDIIQYLHSQNPPIIYSDLKPSNLMIRDKDSEIILVDFGSARVIPPDRKKLTGMGTEGYAPPEQYKGAQDTRSDIYSLAATMHHLLTGRAPDIPFEFIPIRNIVPSINPKLEQIIMKCLQKDINKRYQKIEEVKKELTELQEAMASPKSQSISMSLFDRLKKNFKSIMNIMTKPLEGEERKITLMIVDDEDTLRNMYVEIFSYFNDIQVMETAKNGIKAIQKFKEMKVKPDVIMMDVYMPELDGILATQAILKLSPSTKIVMLTSLSDQGTVIKAFNAGAVGYIVKGARMEYLVEVVREAYRGGSPINPEISKILLKEFLPSKTLTGKKEKLQIFNAPEPEIRKIKLDEGQLSDIILETSSNKFTGKIIFNGEKDEGYIFFKDGLIVNAGLGNLKQIDAIYSIALLNEVTTKFEIGKVTSEISINETTDNIVNQVQHVTGEWIKLREIIGSLDSVFKVSFTRNYEVVSLLPKDLEILAQLNGHASISEVAHKVNKNYFEIAEVIYNLCLMGIIEKVEEKPAK